MIEDLPGGPMASRPVHFFWIVDTSSSMSVEGKMSQLDFAIREALPEMRSVAAENPGADLLIRVLAFANGARWINADPVPVEQFSWNSLPADGLTDFGEALKLLAAQLEVPPMPERALPPVLAVVTDGMPTDDWKDGLAALDRSRWGSKAVRLAIRIGDSTGTNALSILSDFTKNPEVVFEATNAGSLARLIRWVSTVGVKVASDPSNSKATLEDSVGSLVVVDDDDADDWV